MPAAEIETEAGLRNVVSAISAALSPRAVIGSPVSRAILLPVTGPLPAALPDPAFLLLPGSRLLLRTLYWRLVIPLSALLLRLLLRLLSPLRLLLLRLLWTLGRLLLLRLLRTLGCLLLRLRNAGFRLPLALPLLRLLGWLRRRLRLLSALGRSLLLRLRSALRPLLFLGLLRALRRRLLLLFRLLTALALALILLVAVVVLCIYCQGRAQIQQDDGHAR